MYFPQRNSYEKYYYYLFNYLIKYFLFNLFNFIMCVQKMYFAGFPAIPVRNEGFAWRRGWKWDNFIFSIIQIQIQIQWKTIQISAWRRGCKWDNFIFVHTNTNTKRNTNTNTNEKWELRFLRPHQLSFQTMLLITRHLFSDQRLACCAVKLVTIISFIKKVQILNIDMKIKMLTFRATNALLNLFLI